MKPNEWLLNYNNFIDNSNYHNKQYLISLGNYVINYLRNAPIPILSTYDSKHYKIYFTVGHESKGFAIDDNVSYFDYITIIKRWLTQFYPHYVVTLEKEVYYSDEEIIAIRDEAVRTGENFDVNEALLSTKKSTYMETGIIDRITLKSDEFVFDHNGSKFIRISGDMNNLLPLSQFLKEVRNIPVNEIKSELDKREIKYNDDSNITKIITLKIDREDYLELQSRIHEKVRQYILDNSREVRPINNQFKEIVISYPEETMFNFFKINYTDLKNEPFIHHGNMVSNWGRFKIKFQSEISKQECISFYEKMKG